MKASALYAVLSTAARYISCTPLCYVNCCDNSTAQSTTYSGIGLRGIPSAAALGLRYHGYNVCVVSEYILSLP